MIKTLGTLTSLALGLFMVTACFTDRVKPQSAEQVSNHKRPETQPGSKLSLEESPQLLPDPCSRGINYDKIDSTIILSFVPGEKPGFPDRPEISFGSFLITNHGADTLKYLTHSASGEIYELRFDCDVVTIDPVAEANAFSPYIAAVAPNDTKTIPCLIEFLDSTAITEISMNLPIGLKDDLNRFNEAMRDTTKQRFAVPISISLKQP